VTEDEDAVTRLAACPRTVGDNNLYFHRRKMGVTYYDLSKFRQHDRLPDVVRANSKFCSC